MTGIVIGPQLNSSLIFIIIIIILSVWTIHKYYECDILYFWLLYRISLVNKIKLNKLLVLSYLWCNWYNKDADWGREWLFSRELRDDKRTSNKMLKQEQDTTKVEGHPPRVILWSLCSHCDMPTNVRILLQEVPPQAALCLVTESCRSVGRGSVFTLSHVWSESRPGGLDSGQWHTYKPAFAHTHSHTHPNNNNGEKDVGAIICIVMPWYVFSTVLIWIKAVWKWTWKKNQQEANGRFSGKV